MLRILVAMLFVFSLSQTAHAQSAISTSGAQSASGATAIGTQSGAQSVSTLNQTIQGAEIPKQLPGTPGIVVPQGSSPTNLGGSPQVAEIIATMAFVEGCHPSYTRETRLLREKTSDSLIFFTPHQNYVEMKKRSPSLQVEEVVPGFSRKTGSYVCLGQLTVKHKSGEPDVAFQTLPDAAAAYLLDNLVGTQKVHIISHFDLVSLFSTMQGEAKSFGGGLSIVGSLLSAALQAIGIGGSSSSGSSASRTEYGVTYFVLGETADGDPLATQINVGETLKGLLTSPQPQTSRVTPPVEAAVSQPAE